MQTGARKDALPFDAPAVVRRLRGQVRTLRQKAAAMFLLADEGHDSVFEQVVAAIISVRALEEVTLPASRRLFSAARTPAAVAALGVDRIDALIRPTTFHEPKARQIYDIAVAARDAPGGALPCEYAALLAAADLGLCLHRSASGVDLPMKIADMWGAGLPVCALDYGPCLRERVLPGVNGLLFADAAALAAELADVALGRTSLEVLRAGAIAAGAERWDAGWRAVVSLLLPLRGA